MYQAKENGRNRVCVYSANTDWRAQSESRLSWRKRIGDALECDRFVLFAQPILDLSTNRVSQYELLLRMIDTNGSVIDAGAFIDSAERFGLMQAIDRWVVRQGIRIAAEYARRGRDVRTEINISGKAFADDELLPLIRSELTSTQVDPRNLIFEVTESAAIHNIHEAREFVDELKRIGCRFALDDFGVGFSSFYQLKSLDVDFLKIDGSFIQDLPNDEIDQHLVRAIVEVARALNKETIAEFVADEETTHLLRELGVGFAQGYHLGRPRDAWASEREERAA
jgi:EAL domain-containing protein (putative c-di-GMP-specific phosphodiesterase class I)